MDDLLAGKIVVCVSVANVEQIVRMQPITEMPEHPGIPKELSIYVEASYR